MIPHWRQTSLTAILRGACRHAVVEWEVERNLLPSLFQWFAEPYAKLVTTYDWPETSSAVEVAFEGGFWDDEWETASGIPAARLDEHIYYYEGKYWQPIADTQISPAGTPPSASAWTEVETIQTRLRLDGPTKDSGGTQLLAAPTLPPGSTIFGIYRADPAATPAAAGRPLRYRHYGAGWLHVVTPPGVLTVWVHHAPPAPAFANIEEWDEARAYDFSSDGAVIVWNAPGDGKLYRLLADSSAGTVPADGGVWELLPLPARLEACLARFVAASFVANMEGDTPRASSHRRQAEDLLDNALAQLASSLR